METGLYYLAIPYKGNEEQQEYRRALSLKVATEFLRQGIHVFAPVNYVNQFFERLDPLSFEKRRDVIITYCLAFVRGAKGLILITAEGWQDSWGVQKELQCCLENQIPIYKISPEQIGDNMAHIFNEPWDPTEFIQLDLAS